jgi:hypothetical protein
MGKIEKAPRKTPEELAADKQEFLNNVKVGSSAAITPPTEATSTNPKNPPGLEQNEDSEQEGKKAPAPPLAESPPPPAPIAEPAATVETRAPSPASSATPAVAPPASESVSSADSPTPAKQPIAPAPAPSTSPAPAPLVTGESETSEPVDEPGSARDEETFDLASLFEANPPGRKSVTCRLTASQHQYLLTLGIILGNGTSPPEIIYNLIEQFITKHDKQIQKAISKQMRVGRTQIKKT